MSIDFLFSSAGAFEYHTTEPRKLRCCVGPKAIVSATEWCASNMLVRVYNMTRGIQQAVPHVAADATAGRGASRVIVPSVSGPVTLIVLELWLAAPLAD